MTNITPPRELISQWLDEFWPIRRDMDQDKGKALIERISSDHIVTRAAQWGADQELEACCKYITACGCTGISNSLRTARRPKPPSLKEQAMQAWCRFQASDHTTADEMMSDFTTIRRALEQLND